MSLLSISLELAFREPGCPLCRLRQQWDGRYLFTLLYENVNDGGTRQHLVRGMGLCPRHSWALQATEQERWHDGLGVGIIYEDLTSRALRTLSAHLQARTSTRAGRRMRLFRWLERSGSMGRQLARWLLPATPGASLSERLSAVEHCRVCDLVGQMEEIYLKWLVGQLITPGFRDLYGASDGLCLPHLRHGLAIARDEESVRCLVEVAVAKLSPLAADLSEYVRKHDWNNRHEPNHPWEQAAWMRAVALFAGEAPGPVDEDIHRLRQKALIDYHNRSGVLEQGR